ncbi:ribokinase [Asaia lannensis]|uniref:Ribokinase n=1 Tax=Asaia lannensis NBRC 102526 TaxID=1307926 RepID=A0ABT1CJ67_9PROT|nr:ribokinase [Asaia lannensis]MCO6160910.1 ribokinase [Asaia lannensis NBRC 102526]GBR01590.1 ribokinase [Asaia lannensis NBRC 102526]
MSDKPAHILSFGSVNIDITARAERIPHPGETVHAASYATGLGGKGANQAAAAARLGQGCGLSVFMAGRIGTDSFGSLSRKLLTPFGVDLSALREDPDHPTGVALITVDNKAENIITVAGGANMALDSSDVAAHRALIHSASALLLQLEIPLELTVAIAEEAQHAGTLVIVDPAPAPANGLPDALWQALDVITPNETETRLLTGIYPETQADAARAARKLKERGATHALVKMGARGVYYLSGEREGFVPPYPVEAIDTVAAGDCFNAGLATALTLGKDFGEAVHFAAACGALATTRPGAAESAPHWQDVVAMVESRQKA